MAFDHGASYGMAFMVNGTLQRYEQNNLKKEDSLKEFYNAVTGRVIYWQPDVIVIEKINVAGTTFGGNNVVRLAELRAIIKLVCEERGIKCVEVNPTTMKKYITGYGKATKREVAEVLGATYGIDADEICKPEYYVKGDKKGQVKKYIAEASDAIALAHYVYETEYMKDFPRKKFYEIR